MNTKKHCKLKTFFDGVNVWNHADFGGSVNVEISSKLQIFK